MRLPEAEAHAIRICAKRHFGDSCAVRLFGSRTQDASRGSDIDLHIEAERPEMARLANELLFLEDVSM